MPATLHGRRAWSFVLVAASLQFDTCWSRCEHEQYGLELPLPGEAVGPGGYSTWLQEGRPVFHELSPNKTRHYYYETFNVTTMGLPNRYRKLIISLEPCEGVVYLLVRRTRRCWPRSDNCCKPAGQVPSVGSAGSSPPCNPAAHRVQCDWTHFHSVLDGSGDGAPTFFEIPLGSTKYFISVFAPEGPNLKHGVLKPTYRLMALTDIGAYPRPGLQGRLQTQQIGDKTVELTWEPATFVPVGVSALKRYHVFSSLLLAKENRTNSAVFLHPSKVMNSACGLERNAVHYGTSLTSAVCSEGICRATISGVVPRKRYMFNIVSESNRGFNSTYSGIIVSAEWTETTQLFSDSVVALLGAISGTVFGVIVIGYLWIVKLYK
mmetsp:Transcript_148/g.553  ORF Transcript_148/g.553 Transcript_148/m.553 type:complete len:377 (-) Transcript_148:183-1313(-)